MTAVGILIDSVARTLTIPMYILLAWTEIFCLIRWKVFVGKGRRRLVVVKKGRQRRCRVQIVIIDCHRRGGGRPGDQTMPVDIRFSGTGPALLF